MRTQKINVIFAPYYANNPYQKLLIKSLNKFGVNTTFLESKLSKLIIKNWRKNNLLHLHWIHPFYISRNFLLSAICLIIFISELVFFKVIGTKIVWTVHNLEAHENKFPKLDKICRVFIARIADAILVHTKIGKNKIISKFNLKNEKKIFVIPHGNYISYYENKINKEKARKILEISENRFTYLFFGQIRPYKNIFELIDSFKRLPNQKEIQLIIAGNPLNKDLIIKLKKEIKENKNIRLFSCFIPEKRVQLYMNSADVVVLPYKNILTSGSAILAMSFGKPLITPTRGDLPEILNKSFAFFYDPNKKGNLLRAMDIAFKNRSKTSKMGKSAYNNVKKLNWDKIAKMTFKVYKNSLDI